MELRACMGIRPDLGSRQGAYRPQAVQLRQYFPKGIDLAAHSQAELNKVARQLNERPRKTLDFQSPAERFSQCVAATG
jgi:IS30 family transposase